MAVMNIWSRSRSQAKHGPIIGTLQACPIWNFLFKGLSQAFKIKDPLRDDYDYHVDNVYV